VRSIHEEGGERGEGEEAGGGGGGLEGKEDRCAILDCELCAAKKEGRKRKESGSGRMDWLDVGDETNQSDLTRLTLGRSCPDG